MSITKLKINNCKSIEFAEIILNENINCFIGTNNVGKSNIMKAINFFYLNLTTTVYDDSMFSKSNPYNDELEISLEYDLSELIKKMKINTYGGLLDPTNELFGKIEYYSNKYCENNKVILSMKYNKNKNIEWNIKDYEFRSFIAVRFPIFYLESRNIDLYNWESIWGVIGSIAPFRQKVNITESLKGIFEENNNIHDNYQEVIDVILDVFDKSEVKINKTNIFEKISQIIQLQLGGKSFNYDSHTLQSGSYGMNSYTYINLYINLILRLFEYKYLATPLIMLDEPELHLHIKKIEEFIKGIKEKNNYQNTKWIFATHSPAFTKNIILENENHNIYLVTNNRLLNRTYINKINGFRQKKYKNLSDNEATLFFSEVCLFVEGETELELFRNKNIQSLFPKLSHVDIYSFDGKNDKLQLVNPYDRKSKIKYLVLLDLDKILNYVPEKKKFSITGSDYLNVLKNTKLIDREKYTYGKKFSSTFNTRKIIQNKIDSTEYNIDLSGLCLKEDFNRSVLISLIQNYFRKYNFFPLETTIEGSIINVKNYEIFYEWIFQSNWDKTKFKEIYDTLTSDIQKTSFLRLIFFGKADWLSGEKQKSKKNLTNYKTFITTFEDIKKIRNDLKKSNLNFDGKTGGWVTLFIDWYFERDRMFQRNSNIYLNRKRFISEFPELGKVIVCLEQMV